MLNVIMPSIVMLGVVYSKRRDLIVMLNVIKLSIFNAMCRVLIDMQNVVMLSVIMLSVVCAKCLL
jgi:hypothetical protein